MNINSVDPQGLKIYPRATKEIYKEADKLYISVFNVKDSVYHFLGLYNKYGWGRLTFMVDTGVGEKNIFRQAEQFQISDMHHKLHGCFVLLGIENLVDQVLPNPLVVPDLQNLSNN